MSQRTQHLCPETKSAPWRQSLQNWVFPPNNEKICEADRNLLKSAMPSLETSIDFQYIPCLMKEMSKRVVLSQEEEDFVMVILISSIIMIEFTLP